MHWLLWNFRDSGDAVVAGAVDRWGAGVLQSFGFRVSLGEFAARLKFQVREFTGFIFTYLACV